MTDTPAMDISKARIAVDILGGDDAPGCVVEGCSIALERDPSLFVIACGPKEVVEPLAQSQPRCTAVPTTEVISMDEHPAEAVRRKKDSSLVVACRLVKEGQADGFFSAGSTGACMTAATLVIGRIHGISRPAIMTVVPGMKKTTLLLDCGANADCKPEYLLQFARMGIAYARGVLGIEQPKVGLLNIGEEETKGNEFALETHRLLKTHLTSFGGNAEGRDIMTGTFDIIVTDGFTGNVALKSMEGVSKAMLSGIKGVMMKSLSTKLATAVLKPGMKQFAKSMSPDSVGGAPLLGVKGACIIGHGSSSAEAIANGITTSSHIAKARIADLIASELDSDHGGAKPDPTLE